jgi:predicted RNA-binding protein with PIN domain
MYLVDGNNVIGQRPGWHRDKPGSRRRLLRETAELARRYQLTIAVVFDGTPDPGFPEGSRHGRVRIHYARRGSDADSRIVEMIESDPNRRNITVVTSDAALAGQVRVCGARVMRSGEFRRRLDSLSAHPAEASPRVAPDEADEWMRYFGVDENDSDDDYDD